MKIRVKLHDGQQPLEILEQGDWVDLRSNIEYTAHAPTMKLGESKLDVKLVPLGIAMELPKYFEANILPRSGSFKNFGFVLLNSMGIIDHSYRGNNDEWMANLLFLKKAQINKGDRILQFRIRPSQFAPWWVHLKWIFKKKIEFVYVEDLENNDRGGFGSSGTK